jgi:Tol biopolymer transport system component
MRKLIICGVLVALAVSAGVAGARPAGSNGQIAFARFNPALGDTQVYVVNPDGTNERLVQGSTDTGECPTWFADGAHIAVCGSPARSGGSRIINPDDGTFRDVGGQDPNLFNPCGIPSPDGTLLLCETFSDDGSLNGIHLIRSSDGGGLQQVTSNPGGDDVPGSWSPDGKRIVFHRFGPNDDEGVFVVNVNGTGLKQILPPSLAFGCCALDWSPQGNEIVFSRHVSEDVHSSIWVVRADGSGLHEVNVQPSSACGGANSDPTADGCTGPSWSPDGTKIVFAKGQNTDVDANIYTVNVDGTGLTQVTHTGGSQSPDWGVHPLAR